MTAQRDQGPAASDSGKLYIETELQAIRPPSCRIRRKNKIKRHVTIAVIVGTIIRSVCGDKSLY